MMADADLSKAEKALASKKFSRIARNGTPAWMKASDAEKAQYLYISFASTGGLYSDGTPGNPIFSPTHLTIGPSACRPETLADGSGDPQMA